MHPAHIGLAASRGDLDTMREPHREVLVLRGLAMRGHLVPRRRTRGAAGWKAAVAFLARHGDNGVVWNVLSFWRATK